jgi:serine/threonine-protein kinase
MNIARYHILEEIGRGAMGLVYKAHDPNLNIMVALKVMRKDRLTNESAVRRFMGDAQAAVRLDHPDIVRVFNVDRDGDEYFIAMEFIQGKQFTTVMKQQQFSLEAICAFGARMAEALDYAHKRGIIHRDVKPDNILCTADGKLKITDFGIAHIDDPSGTEETQVGEILGTPAYMSPEQVLGRPVDGRSDIFSLGVILYELATGSRPFKGQGMNAVFNAIINEVPADISTLNPQIPAPLCAAIMKCLSKSQEGRHSDGRELAAVLRSTLAPPGLFAQDEAPQKEKSGKNNNSKVIIAAALVMVVIVVALFFFRTPTTPAVKVSPLPPQPAAIVQKTTRLKAESTPSGATLFVDGIHVGTTPTTVSVEAGKHELILSLPEYDKWEAQVELEKGTETPVSINLTPIRKK